MVSGARIIAGGLGGRQFAIIGEPRTHPMSDKVRGALFNTPSVIYHGLTVLDAYAGTGALLHRQSVTWRIATSVTAIDTDTETRQTIAANVATLGLIEQK